MKIDEHLEILIRASYPLIYVLTWEEERCLRMIRGISKTQNLAMLEWSTCSGLIEDKGKILFPPAKEPAQLSSYIPALMQYILTFKQENVIFVIKDLHPYIKEPIVTRFLRDIASHFKTCSRTMILLSPVAELPVELEKDVTLLDYELPDESEVNLILEDFIKGTLEQNPEVEMNLEKPEHREKFEKSMLGLTQCEIENTLARIVVQHKRFDIDDIPEILMEKEQIIRKSGILEFYATSDNFGDVGGLDELKSWLGARIQAFSEQARKKHLPPPKGILLVGVPGCGKSLCAKAVASEWGKPLLKFDMGKIYGMYLGESEANLRKAIQVAESVSPAILWIDEIEKGLAGGAGDSGVSQRILGTLLTWMEEKTSPVFVVATANQIAGLPPELLRKGRIDEIFFVDLPNKEERMEIFNVHLSKRNRNPMDFDLEKLVGEADGFSGAEIEQVIIAALFDSFHKGVEMDTDIISNSIRKTIPLSVSMSESITRLRNWASTRCRFATSEARIQELKEQATVIDLGGKVQKQARARHLSLTNQEKNIEN